MEVPPPPNLWEDESYTKKFMEWWNKQEGYYSRLLEPVFQRCVQSWKRYLLEREDDRDEDEQWRAFVTDPGPYQVIETMLQALVEIFGDGGIQGDKTGGTEADAQSVENNVNVVLRKNRFPNFLNQWFRNVLIQGFQPVKIVQWRDTVTVRRTVGKSDFDLFRQEVNRAEQASGVPAPTGDPMMFDEWRKAIALTTDNRIRVGEPPVPGEQTKVLYEGPKLILPSIYTMRFDPSVSDWQQQPILMQRFVVPAKYIEENTDYTDVQGWTPDPKKPWCTADPGKPFYGPTVVQALSAGGSAKLSEWEGQIGKMLGYDLETDNDPSVEEPQELFENWIPRGEDAKHVLILNREAPINKNSEREYDHGMAPWVNLRNLPLEGSLGFSEMKPSWSSFEEHERLRELFLDTVLIQVMPLLYTLTSSGVDEEELQEWAPGKTFTISKPDSIGSIKLPNPGIADLLRAIQFLRGEQDDSHATWGQVRGQEAPIGRVTADEARSRLNQALLRLKARVSCWADEMQPMVYQILGLLAQFASHDDLVTIGGTDPFTAIPKQRFFDAMFANYRLRGPIDHLNKLQNAEQLMAFAKTFGEQLRPDEQRYLMELVLRMMGVKEVRNIVSEKGTAETLQAFAAPPPAMASLAGMLGPGGGGPGAPGGPAGPAGPPGR
jgi:hypothetical protein